MLVVIRSKTVAEWYEVFDAEPDVFAEVFRTGSELLHHPQIAHDGMAVEITDPEVGHVLQPGPLVKLAGTPASMHGRAPALDEQGAQLRRRRRPDGAAPSVPPY